LSIFPTYKVENLINEIGIINPFNNNEINRPDIQGVQTNYIKIITSDSLLSSTQYIDHQTIQLMPAPLV
jgi:hypothetical protein